MGGVGGKRVVVLTTTGSMGGDVPGQRGSLRFVDPTGGNEGGKRKGGGLKIGRKLLHDAWRLTLPELKVMLKQGMKEAQSKEGARKEVKGGGRGWLGWWVREGGRASHQHTDSSGILGAATTATAAAATVATTATTAKENCSSRHHLHYAHPDINAIDVTGSTPLMFFAEQGSIAHGKCVYPRVLLFLLFFFPPLFSGKYSYPFITLSSFFLIFYFFVYCLLIYQRQTTFERLFCFLFNRNHGNSMLICLIIKQCRSFSNPTNSPSPLGLRCGCGDSRLSRQERAQSCLYLGTHRHGRGSL